MIVEDDGVERKYAQCKFCKSLLKSDPNRNGTSTLKKHSEKCKKTPDNIKDKNQTKLSLKKDTSGDASVTTRKVDT